jgi:multidrug transporter EmrE-like cation transporter
MLFLILAIISSSLISIIFKYTEDSKSNRYAINTFNYIIATSISLVMLKGMKIFRWTWFKTLFQEIKPVLRNESLFTGPSSMAWAVIIGTVTGALYYLGFYLYQYNVNHNGAGLSTTFMRLGILVPTILSMILFKEMPTSFQIIGIILAILGIVIVNSSLKSKLVRQINFGLLLLFFVGGIADFNAKIYQNYALSQYESLFVFYIFFTALLISIIMLWLKNRKIRKVDALAGLIVGIPNQLTSVFILKALAVYPASLVFPIFSSGTILFVNIMSIFLFQSKLNKKQYIAMGIILLSLIFLNMS